MNNWMHQCSKLLNQHSNLVMVTVVQTKGSTPREMGAKFFVLPNTIVGTIGGGNLEHQATKMARSLFINEPQHKKQVKHFSLAAGLGMCCGGVVELMFELLDQSDLNWLDSWLECEKQQQAALLITQINAKNSVKSIHFERDIIKPKCELAQSVKGAAKQFGQTDKQNVYIKNMTETLYIERVSKTHNQLYLFGAGHVGQAVVALMNNIPWQITWVDTRDDILSEYEINKLSSDINYCVTDSPEAEIAQAKANSYFLVMTHDHALDLVLCEQILKRGDADYFGVIGSNTKRQRFEHRLLAKGFNKNQLTSMVCPIGIKGIKSKQAAAIAISVVAQLLQQAEVISERNLMKETA